jgi:hypothetical protein
MAFMSHIPATRLSKNGASQTDPAVSPPINPRSRHGVTTPAVARSAEAATLVFRQPVAADVCVATQSSPPPRAGRGAIRPPRRWMAAALLGLLLAPTVAAAIGVAAPGLFAEDIRRFSDWGDRRSGSAGAAAAAAVIQERFTALGLESVGRMTFALPVRRHGGSRLQTAAGGRSVALQPVLLNAISPENLPPDGVEGPLVYVGRGELSNFNGKPVEGTIVLMDLDSGNNWINAAALGAKALIYLVRGPATRFLYEDKAELSPINFPRFQLGIDAARTIVGALDTAVPSTEPAPVVRIFSDIMWQEIHAQNVYGLIPGSDPELKDRSIVVEAFYDSKGYVAGLSPGADEAVGIATLLDLARRLKQHPPGRSVLLVATDGHAQSLAGMREMIWSIHSRSKDIRQLEKTLKKTSSKTQRILSLLEAARQNGIAGIAGDDGRQLAAALGERIKTEVDAVSRRLMRLRLENQNRRHQAEIRQLAHQRLLLRRLGWRQTLEEMPEEEINLLLQQIPDADADYRNILEDTHRQLEALRDAKQFRSLAKSTEIEAVVSLHLSSHGDGFGAFSDGWLYALRARVNRTADYRMVDEVLRAAAKTPADAAVGKPLYRDTLRPSRLRTWQSYLPDRPPLGGEVSALAGYIGFTFVTVDDARPLWGTPDDRAQGVDVDYAHRQSRQLSVLIERMTQAPRLHSDSFPRDGFTTVSGRAKFLRHGELFPDQPAPDTVIMAFQGPGRYYSRVDSLGNFYLKGVSTKKLVQDKVIIEGYRFDPTTGAVIWAIDKAQTGKDAYRLKIERSNMETNLVMFGCRQTTLFNLLEPRNFRYMTRIQLIDGRREAKPVRYWWSRIDTRSSVIASVYLDPGTRMKLTLSDSMLTHKLILLNASADNPQGAGYLVDEWPNLYRTDYLVAKDMWALLGPRIANLEKHGIYNDRIAELHREGTAALVTAKQALAQQAYDRFYEAATRSWALASRVYSDVESTQKDVLFGVLFYIALFVPFAFCMERLLFSYTNIHKRILAFVGILLLLIAVIYKVHPAFQLAYNPTVVILAFFIMGLSLIVTLIIYFRFEEEMTNLQRRARHLKAAEIGRWKAFTAAFLLGVSNLRRRRLRTALTCITLVILTFTVMSFTSVKSMRRHTRLLFENRSPYLGYLFKNFNWADLPAEALDAIADYFDGSGLAAPRVWLEDPDRTRAPVIPVQWGERRYEAQAMVGLSADEVRVSGMDSILVGGRWFLPQERRAALLPEPMARQLGIDPRNPQNQMVRFWGMDFAVVGVFSDTALMAHLDLDGEPLTPVTFPSEVTVEMTDVEMDAMESGEEVEVFQSRYQHMSGSLTVIVPAGFLLSAGGRLKAVAVASRDEANRRSAAEELVDRFGVTVFAGESAGVFVYQASDTMSYSGVPNVVIPLVISIFIVLNTMIGSVYERKREIAIYTSVGLAPSHVSFLFIAEALAFAVISVVLGYLLAQITASLFAGTALWAGITVNYSSMAGVAAMLLVIMVVLVSVIYPSRMAAEIAIPDVNRSWKLPEAVGNRIEVTLPFLMNFREHLSVGGYLLEHFESHQDVSHGLFSAGGIDFTFSACRIPDPRTAATEGAGAAGGEFLQFCVDVWLAPFDFGIMQKAVLAFCLTTEDVNYIEIRVRLERQAGEANAWRRINKAFLNDLRKQLLIWRSLDEATKIRYEAELAAEARKRGMDTHAMLNGNAIEG